MGENREKSSADTFTQGVTPGLAQNVTHGALVPDNPEDARITVSFSQDDFELFGDFVPAMGSGAPLTDEYCNSFLQVLNIVHGLEREAVDRAVALCNTERKIQKGVLIARGTPPQNEIGEYMQLNPALGQNQIDSSGSRVDYRSYTPFIIVKKGQALAKQKQPKRGKDGINIHGQNIPYKTVNPAGVTGGDNTQMEGRFLLASISGQMVVEKGVVHVRETLNIKGPVGYRTGNITFPGDVIIEGPVSDGFKIYSGGSIMIKQTFDVTDTVAKGDLVVAGGIIGRGLALVKCGGALKTKFIENCRVAARKTVSVTNEIISSSVYTLENIEMADKGKIIGSEIYAVGGVRAGSIGKVSSRAARIHCGIDFTLEQEKEKYNNTLRLLAAKLERIRQLSGVPPAENSSSQSPDSGDARSDLSAPEDSRGAEAPADTEKKAKLEELRLRLEEEQRKAAAKVSELLGRVIANENAAVEVSGEIMPGTFIEICKVSLLVTEPLKKVRITLDREQGKLVSSPL